MKQMECGALPVLLTFPVVIEPRGLCSVVIEMAVHIKRATCDLCLAGSYSSARIAAFVAQAKSRSDNRLILLSTGLVRITAGHKSVATKHANPISLILGWT